ncbi:MAG: hypothetical protein ACRYGK_14745 [Janthinobacterium lividum]
MQEQDYILTEPPEPVTDTPWIDLRNVAEAETWIEDHNRNLQRYALKAGATGYGVRFNLEHGGDITMHTNQDGDILLDVSPEADWIAPLITAATRVPAPAARIWLLPGDTLTQLILGLNSMIATSRTVLGHEFRTRKWR